MAYVKGQPFKPQFHDPATGVLMASGTIEFYVTGTSTPTAFYTDDIGTGGGNSLTLDTGGLPPTDIYYDTSVTYKLVLKDALGTTIYTLDPYTIADQALVVTNAANIATNTADIATNVADIATNTADIATNVTDIATNTAAIATINDGLIGDRVELTTITDMTVTSISEQSILWDIEDLDDIGAHDTVTNNNRVTVPTDYTRIRLFFDIPLRPSAAANQALHVNLKKNGSLIKRSHVTFTNTSVANGIENAEYASRWMNTVATDYYEITLGLAVAGTNIIFTSSSTTARFSAEMMKV